MTTGLLSNPSLPTTLEQDERVRVHTARQTELSEALIAARRDLERLIEERRVLLANNIGELIRRGPELDQSIERAETRVHDIVAALDRHTHEGHAVRAAVAETIRQRVAEETASLLHEVIQKLDEVEALAVRLQRLQSYGVPMPMTLAYLMRLIPPFRTEVCGR